MSKLMKCKSDMGSKKEKLQSKKNFLLNGSVV